MKTRSGKQGTGCLMYSFSGPAALSASGGFRPEALRPYLSESLPFNDIFFQDYEDYVHIGMFVRKLEGNLILCNIW